MAHILICDDDIAVHTSLGIYLEADNFSMVNHTMSFIIVGKKYVYKVRPTNR